MTALDVIDGGKDRWSCEAADVVTWLRGLPDDSVDLLVTSPPYELARTYGIGERMVGGEKWVSWMVDIVAVASKKVKGLIVIVCEGQTRQYRYSCVPFLLMADLHRAGFNLRKPPVFHRVGIPGSGGPDWLRNDWEPIVCVTRTGKLPWSDNTACGHPPKWAPGGEMSHRLSSGTRKNQWGGGPKSYCGKKQNGEKDKRPRPSHVLTNGDGKIKAAPPKFSHENGDLKKRKILTRDRDGTHSQESTFYDPPAIANPGNVLRFTVGGNQMGHDIAHENEAPFPLDLAAFFVKSFCPPDGVTCDPFSGSGTTAHAAIENGRRFVGCDVRQSQVDLCRRRLRTVTPSILGAAP